MTTSIPRAPLVSVVMAVKNGGELMREAVDSILNQTFTDFEFIIINDGSTDNTLDILSEYKDPRIQVYSQENRGVARSANRGLALAKGKYIARQDHDDISLPTRLAKQYEFLELNLEVGLVGSNAEIWTDNGYTGRNHSHPTNSSVLAFELIFNNPFVHSSCMFREEILKKVGLYNPLVAPLDDYEFIARISRSFKVANLKDNLVKYREVNKSLTSAFRDTDKNNSVFEEKLSQISLSNLLFYLPATFPKNKVQNFGRIHHRSSRIKLHHDKLEWLNSSVNIASENIFNIYKDTEIYESLKFRLDNLKHRWYNNPGFAPYFEKKIYHLRELLEKKIYHLRELLVKKIYTYEITIKIFLSKIKKKSTRLLEAFKK